MKLAINGLLSLTPDGNPIIGETPEVKGLWSAAAIWIKEAPGIAQTHRRVDDERRARDRPARLGHRPVLRAPQDREAHRGPDDARATTRPTASSTRWSSGPRTAACGSRRSTSARRSSAPSSSRPPGWERPYWYGTNERLLAEYGDRGDAARGRVGVALVVADHQRRAPRDARSGRDRRPVRVRDLRRHRAGRAPRTSSGCASTRSTSPPGKTVYTPLLNGAGGILADLTIMRLAHDRFRVVTGGGMGMRDKKLFTDALPEDGSAQLFDATNCFTTIGLWGPRARDILAGATSDDVSHAGLPVPDLEDGRDQRRSDARVAHLVRRRARLGDLRPDRAGPARLGRALGGRHAARAASRSGSGRTR